jgi:hypothetical protein
VAAGALGLSSSRVSSHRDATGVLLPGSLASRGELLAMGNGIADGGGGVFELASSWDLYDDFVREGRPDRELVREYERKDRDLLHAMATIPGVTVTTGGGSGQPVGGGTSMTPETAWSHTGVLEMIDAITASGGDMWTTPMMRLGNVFIGIKGEAMNPLLASKRFRSFVNMDVTSRLEMRKYNVLQTKTAATAHTYTQAASVSWLAAWLAAWLRLCVVRLFSSSRSRSRSRSQRSHVSWSAQVRL